LQFFEEKEAFTVIDKTR